MPTRIWAASSRRSLRNLSLATSERWTNRSSGERRERTEWHRVVIFDEKLCEIATKYLQKGSKIYVEGQLQTRKWTDQSGNDRYSTEVVLRRFNGAMTMLDSRGEGGFGGGDSYAGGAAAGGGGAPESDRAGGGGGGGDFDDDIPSLWAFIIDPWYNRLSCRSHCLQMPNLV